MSAERTTRPPCWAKRAIFCSLFRRQPLLVRHDQHAVSGQLIQLLVEDDPPGHVTLDQALLDREVFSRAEVLLGEGPQHGHVGHAGPVPIQVLVIEKEADIGLQFLRQRLAGQVGRLASCPTRTKPHSPGS